MSLYAFKMYTRRKSCKEWSAGDPHRLLYGGFAMKKSKQALLPRRKAEHLLTMSAALIVLIGGLSLVSWHRNVTNASSPAAEASPAPGPLAGLVILVDPGHGAYRLHL